MFALTHVVDLSHSLQWPRPYPPSSVVSGFGSSRCPHFVQRQSLVVVRGSSSSFVPSSFARVIGRASSASIRTDLHRVVVGDDVALLDRLLGRERLHHRVTVVGCRQGAALTQCTHWICGHRVAFPASEAVWDRAGAMREAPWAGQEGPSMPRGWRARRKSIFTTRSECIVGAMGAACCTGVPCRGHASCAPRSSNYSPTAGASQRRLSR